MSCAYKISSYSTVRKGKWLYMSYRMTTPEKKIEAVSTLFQKGKIQLPSEVRNALGVKDGDKVVWIRENGKWTLEKA